MIRLVRCDDRLIHGQCVLRVLSDYDIRHILLSDDLLAQNPALRAIVLLAAPLDIQTEIASISESIRRIPSLLTQKMNTLLLVRSPSTALALYNAMPKLIADCNIGPIAGGDGSIRITDYCRLSRPDLCAVTEIANRGIRVYFNQVIDQRLVEWTDIEARFINNEPCG